jgi:hypothetical protein
MLKIGGSCFRHIPDERAASCRNIHIKAAHCSIVKRLVIDQDAVLEDKHVRATTQAHGLLCSGSSCAGAEISHGDRRHPALQGKDANVQSVLARPHVAHKVILVLPRVIRLDAMTKRSHKIALSDICPGEPLQCLKAWLCLREWPCLGRSSV